MIIGIVGGGQLARMMALAGIPLGIQFIFLDPAEDACAAPLGEHLCGAYDDPVLLNILAERADVVTYEFENVPASAIDSLAQKIYVYPAQQALSIARDRLSEKCMFKALGIPTVPFVTVDSSEDLQQAASNLGYPCILKTRTMGYDGKGQFLLKNEKDISTAWNALGGVPLILEGFANFTREISIISVRDRNGEMRHYPLSENHHRNGILHSAHSLPADPQQEKAEAYAERLMQKLDYVGVMTLELFDTGEELLANEMAPRVHNSGHWTIEGAITSQFENHLRAITGLPLGSTEAKGYVKMFNFIGEIPDTSRILSMQGMHLHDYNKKPKPGRKIGHATIWSDSQLDKEDPFAAP